MKYTQDAQALSHLNRLIQKHEEQASAAVQRVLNFINVRGEDKYQISVFGRWIAVTPKNAANIKMESVLAIDLATNNIFIDSFGHYGPKKTPSSQYKQVFKKSA